MVNVSLPQYQMVSWENAVLSSTQLRNYALCLLVGAAIGERNVAALIVIFCRFRDLWLTENTKQTTARK